MKRFVLIALVACGGSKSGLSAEDRAAALDAAKQCTDTVASLAPSYQMIGPKLAVALKMDRAEARRLMRDSVELLISTREMLCIVSHATVTSILDKAPRDRDVLDANQRVTDGLAQLAKVRTAYDELLGAATSGTPDTVIDEAALIERFSRALGQ